MKIIEYGKVLWQVASDAFAYLRWPPTLVNKIISNNNDKSKKTENRVHKNANNPQIPKIVRNRVRAVD